MRAIVHRRDGSTMVARCEEIEKPAPRDREVLIRVQAASVNPFDWRMKARRPGRDVAGRVEAIGAQITGFKPGDEVFGTCPGAFADYACAPESTILARPAGVTAEQAACLPIAGLTALQSLRDKGRIQPGEHVLVNGAAGGVGTFAVQIAKSFGARVTAVCSARNVEMVRSIGADRVLDYTRDDFTAGGERYDLILDCVANHSLRACRRVLTPRGRYVTVGGITQSFGGLAGRWIATLGLSLLARQRFVMFVARVRKMDLASIGAMVASGALVPVVDRRYPLEEAPAALQYAGQKHARGKVVITIAPSPA